MKQKYEFIKNTEKNTLVLREYAELDKDILSPLCEEEYDIKTITAAVAEGKKRAHDGDQNQEYVPAGPVCREDCRCRRGIYGRRGPGHG